MAEAVQIMRGSDWGCIASTSTQRQKYRKSHLKPFTVDGHDCTTGRLELWVGQGNMTNRFVAATFCDLCKIKVRVPCHRRLATYRIVRLCVVIAHSGDGEY